MTNKASILTLAIVTILSACSSKNNKPNNEIQKPNTSSKTNNTESKTNDSTSNNTQTDSSETENNNSQTGTQQPDNGSQSETQKPQQNTTPSVADKLAKLPNDTEFNSDMDEIKLEKDADGKWKYTITDFNNKTFTFKADELKDNDIFNESEFTKMNFGIDIDTKLRIIKNSDLTYGHYGFLELMVPEAGKTVSVYNSFMMYDKNKAVDFVRPEQDITFSGSTIARLTTRDNNEFSYKDLTGTASITIGAGHSTGDMTFNYNDWNKTMTVKGVNLSNGKVSHVNNWTFSDPNIHFMNREDMLPTWSHKILDNKEIIGGYKVNLEQGSIAYTVDGVFGMKKQ